MQPCNVQAKVEVTTQKCEVEPIAKVWNAFQFTESFTQLQGAYHPASSWDHFWGENRPLPVQTAG